MKEEILLTEIRQHIKNHDSGIITAVRYGENSKYDRPFSQHEQNQRSESLCSKLASKRLTVVVFAGTSMEPREPNHPTAIDGDIFFVLDLEDKQTLENSLLEIGSCFNQHHVMYIPSGSTTAKLLSIDESTFVGVKDVPLPHPICPNGHALNKGSSSTPWELQEAIYMLEPAQTYFGRWGAHIVAQKHWREIDVSVITHSTESDRSID